MIRIGHPPRTPHRHHGSTVLSLTLLCVLLLLPLFFCRGGA